MCLNYNEFTTPEEKIRTYFEYTIEGVNAWTNASCNIWKNLSQTIICQIKDLYVLCSDDSIVGMIAYSLNFTSH